MTENELQSSQTVDLRLWSNRSNTLILRNKLLQTRRGLGWDGVVLKHDRIIGCATSLFERRLFIYRKPFVAPKLFVARRLLIERRLFVEHNQIVCCTLSLI